MSDDICWWNSDNDQVDITGAMFLTILNILKDDIDDKCSTNDFFWIPHEVLTSCLFKNTSDIYCGWNSYAQTVQYNNYLKCEKTKMPSNSLAPSLRKEKPM